MNASKTLPLVVGLLVVALLGVQIVTVTASDEMQQFTKDAGEWCDGHGGELVNVHSVAHGGLHCVLPNGTSVHMSEVVDGGG